MTLKNVTLTFYTLKCHENAFLLLTLWKKEYLWFKIKLKFKNILMPIKTYGIFQLFSLSIKMIKITGIKELF
jgi:hypothetical protein